MFVGLTYSNYFNLRKTGRGFRFLFISKTRREPPHGMVPVEPKEGSYWPSFVDPTLRVVFSILWSTGLSSFYLSQFLSILSRNLSTVRVSDHCGRVLSWAVHVGKDWYAEERRVRVGTSLVFIDNHPTPPLLPFFGCVYLLSSKLKRGRTLILGHTLGRNRFVYEDGPYDLGFLHFVST